VKLRCELALLPDGLQRDVALTFDAHGRIAAVGAASGDERLLRGLVLPGMPNLHSHAFQRAMAGSAEVAATAEHSFWGWREVMYRFAARLGPEELAAVTAWACLEMLEAGYTEVAEFHYLHHQPDGRAYADPATLALAVRAGARAAGIRQLLLPTLYQQGNFDGSPLAGTQRRYGLELEAYLQLFEALRASESALCSTGLAVHSLRAVPHTALESVAGVAAASRMPAPLHLHIAEQQREVQDCLAFRNQRPVEWLLGTGLVAPHWCLVHATHVDGAELRGLAACGAVVGLCPSTEANLGDGRFALDEFLAAGGRFGIGSDSHVSIDPREELRSLEYTLRLWRERRVLAVDATTPHCGEFLYRHALAGGAQACGGGARGLVAGAPADFIVLDTNAPGFAGLPDAALLDAWIFAPRPGGVREAWVGGERVVSEGRHRDRAALGARYRHCLEHLAVQASA
jgi:formimidoylglutamate deiminase